MPPYWNIAAVSEVRDIQLTIALRTHQLYRHVACCTKIVIHMGVRNCGCIDIKKNNFGSISRLVINA